MKVVTSSQMREIDRRAIEEFGIPGLVLMENAGLQVVEAALTILEEQRGSQVTVLCGIGNNGGDGMVIARHLHNSGYEVACYLIGDPAKLKGDARLNYIILTRIGLAPTAITDEDDLNQMTWSLMKSHLIIDALYGTGFSGKLTGVSETVVALINQSSVPVLAVDIPSGLDADTGSTEGLSVIADWTVTMGLPKKGLLTVAARPYVGRLTVADISLPLELLSSSQIRCNLITPDLVRPHLSTRPLDSHKGDYGHVLIMGGCPNMSGAVVMAALAAMKTGAGLVTAALPAPARNIAAGQLPAAMTRALPATEEGNISIKALTPLLQALETTSAGVLGPGMGRYDEGRDLVGELVKQTPVPLIVDADALNLIADNLELLKAASAPLVLTPHPGEMARLTGLTVKEVQSRREELACNFAEEYGVVLVLKGSCTLVATPAGEIYYNLTGNPGMACGGSGDVLSGVVAGLAAQGLSADTAAWMGVNLHGLAGDHAASSFGERSMGPLEIIAALSQVIKDYPV